MRQNVYLVHNNLSSRAVALLHGQQHRLPLFCIQCIKGADAPATKRSHSMTVTSYDITPHHLAMTKYLCMNQAKQNLSRLLLRL